MIQQGDYVYLKCLVTDALPLGPCSVSELLEPDVVDLIPVHPVDNKINERFRNNPLCFLIEDVIEVTK